MNQMTNYPYDYENKKRGSSKTALIIVLVVLIVAGLLCAFFFWGREYLGLSFGFDSKEKKNDSQQTVEEGAEPIIVIEVHDEIPEEIPPESAETEEDEELPVYEEIYDPIGKQYSVKTANPKEVTLAFTGDIGFAEGYATINKYRSMGSDVGKSFDPEILDTMRNADIMMVNNEFPYSYGGSPTPNKTYTFRADPADVKILNDLGVDIVSLANNHAYDYGPDALIDTFDTLEGAKIPFVGAGHNIEEAQKPAYFHANGHVISYVSATQIERYENPDTKEATEDSPGVLRTLKAASFVPTIQEAANNSDFTVVYVHWGSESTDLVEQSQRDLAKAYVDAGADLIIGDHSHCLQGIDYVGGVPVFFSLGNYWFNSKTLDTCIVRVTLDEECKIKAVEFLPCLQTGSCVRNCDENGRARIINYMRGISNYAEIDDNGFVTESTEDHNTQNGQNTSPAKKVEKPAETPEIDPAALELLTQQLLEQTTAPTDPGVIVGDPLAVPQ